MNLTSSSHSHHAFLRRLRQHQGIIGFTLVELLVAMSVLIAITLMITTLVSNVSRTVELGGRAIDSDAIARSFFTRLGQDIDNMLLRKDINYSFLKDTSNDTVAFLANLDNGNSTVRPVSIVSYEHFGSEMQRATISAIPSSGSGSGGWTAPIFPSATPTLDSDTDDLSNGVTLGTGDFQSFGKEIIRFEYSFLVSDSASGVRAQADVPAGDDAISQLKGIVVAIAVMDPNVLGTLSDANRVILANALNDSDSGSSGGATADIVSLWHGNLRGLPGNLANAAAGVRLYQRVYFFRQ